jgi:hypothetical protein
MFSVYVVAAAFCFGVAFAMLFVVVAERCGAVKEEEDTDLGRLVRSYRESRGLR